MREDFDLRSKNSLGSLDDFYTTVKQILLNPSFFACSISIVYDNTPAHHYSETDVSTSFHVLYKIERNSFPLVYRSSHRIYKGDKDTTQKLFDNLKMNFVANIVGIVDQRNYNLNKFDYKLSFIFAVSRA
ncbi:hypothetical protein J4459_02550 [Candidatus Woesearchaeota archaeon]|nr:hypothetical protein [Candidatus Woesearchaeota archaeon]